MTSRAARLGKVLAAVGVATAPVAGLASPAAADPTSFSSNVCGANGCNGFHHGNVSATLNLKAKVGSFQYAPASIGIQESCTRQFDDFKNFLRSTKSANYYGAFYTQASNTSACAIGGATSGPNGPQNYGVGAYVLSSNDPISNGNYITAPFNAQSGGEVRGSSCIGGDIFGVPVWSCTAHSTPDHTPTAGLQFKELYDKATFLAGFGNRVYWGGDLYVHVNNIPSYAPGFSWAVNREADLCQSGSNTYRWTLAQGDANSTADNTKVDYTFRTGPSTSDCPTDADLSPASELSMYPTTPATSDHRIVGGYQPF
jgi:hypothetical protein